MSGTETFDFEPIVTEDLDRRREVEEALRRQAEEARRRVEEEQARQRALAKAQRAERREYLIGLLAGHAQNLQEARARLAQELDRALLTRIAGTLESARHRLTVSDMTDQALIEVQKDMGWAESMTSALVQQAEVRQIGDLRARRDGLAKRMQAFDSGGFDPEGQNEIRSSLQTLQSADGLAGLEGVVEGAEVCFLAHVDRSEMARNSQRAEVERLNQERLSLAGIAASHPGLSRPVRDRILKMCADVAGALVQPSFPTAEALLQSIREELASGAEGSAKAEALRDDVALGLKRALLEGFGVEPSPSGNGSLNIKLPEGGSVNITTWIEDGAPRISAVFEGFPLVEHANGTSCGDVEDRVAHVINIALESAGFEAASSPSWFRKKARKLSITYSQDEESASTTSDNLIELSNSRRRTP